MEQLIYWVGTWPSRHEILRVAYLQKGYYPLSPNVGLGILLHSLESEPSHDCFAQQYMMEVMLCQSGPSSLTLGHLFWIILVAKLEVPPFIIPTS